MASKALLSLTTRVVAPPTTTRKQHSSRKGRAGRFVRCLAGGGGNGGDYSSEDPSSPVEVRGDWRAFRAALVNQEQAHRAHQQQQNHVVSHVSANLPRLFGKNVGSPGDWAHSLSEAETGCLLLAPENEGGWWQYSVVLVLNHDSEGSTGVILNRPTNELLHRVVPEIDYGAAHHKVLANRRVSMGGPMGCEKGARCLVALSHKELEGATAEVFPGLWHVNDFSAVKPEHEEHLVVFVGYCGWMEGQLDNEVASNAWTVAAASAANTLALVNASARSGDMMGESMWATMRSRLQPTSPRDSRWEDSERRGE